MADEIKVEIKPEEVVVAEVIAATISDPEEIKEVIVDALIEVQEVKEEKQKQIELEAKVDWNADDINYVRQNLWGLQDRVFILEERIEKMSEKPEEKPEEKAEEKVEAKPEDVIEVKETAKDIEPKKRKSAWI